MAASRAAKIPRPPSRSRFQEGSMNDRASNVPPVRFIGPEELAALEKPVDMVAATIRPVAPEDDSPPSQVQQAAQVQEKAYPTVTKRGSKQLLGQVWEGVAKKLRMKKEPTGAGGKKHQQQQQQSQPQPQAPFGDDRPSKEEIYANYHQLVASGFFSSHAIQSTRQPGPGQQQPPPPPKKGAASQPTSPGLPDVQPGSPIQWPLPEAPVTPSRARPSSPIQSPTSAASSRGTKRAAREDFDINDDTLKNHKKVRKTASATHNLALPKLRSSSRLAARRSSSNIPASRNASTSQNKTTTNNSSSGAPGQTQQREPNRLTKRVLSRGQIGVQVPDRGSSAAKRNLSEAYRPPPNTLQLLEERLQQRASMDEPAPIAASERVLRPRRSAAEPLRVRPNANRGIPVVPDIPPKFTYGEDRENDGPWRGLRRTNQVRS